MSSFEKFEDIKAWKKARILTKEIYLIAQTPKLRRNFALKDQIIRCTISISANIAEGYERSSNKEFIYFLAIAKGSAGELRSFLYLLLDIELIQEADFNRLHKSITDISSLLSGLIKYLASSKIPGPRHKKHYAKNIKH